MGQLKTQSQIESPDTSTNAGPTATEPSEIKLDAPPRGSTLLVETALTYARKIGSAQTLEQAQDFARVIVEQLAEVKEKIERQKAAERSLVSK
jgi:hypothetical protein